MSSDVQHLGLLVKRLQHRHHRALEAGLTPLGVSLVQWNALREIERNPGASQNQLAELTFNSAQAFGTLVTRLLARGLVVRKPGEGRAMTLRLSVKGAALLKVGQVVMAKVANASFATLTEAERAELGRLLSKVLAVPGFD